MPGAGEGQPLGLGALRALSPQPLGKNYGQRLGFSNGRTQPSAEHEHVFLSP